MKSVRIVDMSEAEKLLYPGKQLSDFDESRLKVNVLPSGFASFDEKFLLKQGRGELIILGARPSTGKSGLGFQIATHVARKGKAHIFSLEMDHESVATRQMAIEMNLPIDYIQTKGITEDEIKRGKDLLSNLNCVIDDRSGLNITQIVDAAEMQNKKDRTDVIVIDYIQIIPPTKREHSRAIELAYISGQLKELAKKLRTPVIVLSQLNRQSEFREGGRPQLSDLKESGSLEQDADIVVLLHRPEDLPNTTTAIIAKNRNGPTGDITLSFAPAQCKFSDSRSYGGQLE